MRCLANSCQSVKGETRKLVRIFFFLFLREWLPRKNTSRSPIAVGHLANLFFPLLFSNIWEVDFFVRFLYQCRAAANRDSAEYLDFFTIETSLMDCTNNIVFLSKYLLFLRSPTFPIAVLGGLLCEQQDRDSNTFGEGTAAGGVLQTTFKAS